MISKPLPIGLDDFAKVIRESYYYVDKSLFIKELLDKKGEVNLFTRPRRFGKTLNMSMLRYFLETNVCEAKREDNRALFRGLCIMEAGDKYTEEMGKYPVISLSLKSAKQPDYFQAFYALNESISGEYKRHADMLAQMNLNPEDEQRYQRMMQMKAPKEECNSSLYFLSYCLYQAYGKKAVILIDEYDVPLENAYFNGFFKEMMDYIRSLFESALKSNPYLEFGVITGCLRITKESIFTGLNNMKMVSILSGIYDEYFGFTQAEVDQMLKEYDRSHKSELIKQWYDGYRFGSTDVYNPWSVMNFMDALKENPEAIPSPYWANTSSNDIVRNLVERADISVKGELETLIEGGIIEKPVHEDITYDNIYESEDNIWNFLFFTGYLRLVSRRLDVETEYITMAIPNIEVKYIYKNTIQNWFNKIIEKRELNTLISAIEHGDSDCIASELSACLQETISFYDYAENYYHGFLAGLLKSQKKYRVISNRESGNGRPDIVIKTATVRGTAVIMELKTVSEYGKMKDGCMKAAEQIVTRDYAAELQQEGYQNILKYGICFYKKECMVLKC